MIAKAELKGDRPPQLIDELLLKRKNVKKMFVDHRGHHCILLAEHEIFYNNWADG